MAMLAEKLREAVLQAAFSGELSCCFEKDSDIHEQIKQTIKKKNADIKNDLIRRQRKVRFEFDHTILYEIPDSWEWVKLDDIITILGDGIHGTPQYEINGSYYFINGNNLCNKEIIIKNDTKKVGEEEYRKHKKELNERTILVSINGTLGNVAFYNNEPVILGKSACYFNVYDGFNKDYLYLFFHSQFFLNYITENATGTTIKNVSLDVMRSTHIPIPSQEEQQRIVDRVNELMAKIDEFETIENELEALKAAFPGKMKEALLQAAMEGKLSDRLASDTAVDIDASFTDNDLDLISLPDEWKWCSIKDVVDIRTGLSFKKTDQRDSSTGDLRVLRGGNISDNQKYVLKDDDIYVEHRKFKDKYIPLKTGDVIMPSVTSMEKMCKTGYIDRDLHMTTAGGFVYIMRCIDQNKCDPRFMQLFMNSPFHKKMCKSNIHKSGQAFYNLKKTGLVAQPISMPPIEEQQRIVDRLGSLLPLCDDLVELSETHN